MLSKTKKQERIDAEQREQYDYARRRIRQKKNLLRHFIFFLAGSILFIILNVLEIGNDILGNDWYIWAILIWLFFILIHVFNVFVLNTFMGKEWEDRQLEKLKRKQIERLAKLQKKVETIPENELIQPESNSKEENPNDLEYLE